jgi:apolipoprotein N-acyltransferase
LVSGAAVLSNVLICQWVGGERSSAAAMAACIAGLVFASVLRLTLAGKGEPFVVSVLQPGVDMAFGDESTLPQRLRAAIEPLLKLADNNGSEMAVLPEGVADARNMQPDIPFSLPRIPILLGARRGRKPSYESAFAFDGGKWTYADKTRLVIFGEFVPGRDLFPFLAEAFNLPAGDMTAGEHGVQALRLAGRTVGPVICWEEMFPDVSYRQALNGAQLLAVISIDDWFMNSSAPEELRAGCIWRTIETGLPLVRSASSGYTMAIDGQGRVLGQLPLGISANLRAVLSLDKGRQLFPLLPAFPILCILGALVALVPPPKARTEVEDGRNVEELVVH